MPNPFGSRYGRPKRGDMLRGSVLGVRVRAAETTPEAIPLTAPRRGLLEAVAAGNVRHYPSSGWKVKGGTAVNDLVRRCVAAGWVREWVADGRLHVELTDLGRKAIGEDEPA
jgi:hypothetical protein